MPGSLRGFLWGAVFGWLVWLVDSSMLVFEYKSDALSEWLLLVSLMCRFSSALRCCPYTGALVFLHSSVQGSRSLPSEIKHCAHTRSLLLLVKTRVVHKEPTLLTQGDLSRFPL